MYDTRYCVDCLSVVGYWIKRWTHWEGRSAALRYDEVSDIDRPFIFCTEVDLHANRFV